MLRPQSRFVAWWPQRLLLLQTVSNAETAWEGCWSTWKERREQEHLGPTIQHVWSRSSPHSNFYRSTIASKMVLGLGVCKKKKIFSGLGILTPHWYFPIFMNPNTDMLFRFKTFWKSQLFELHYTLWRSLMSMNRIRYYGKSIWRYQGLWERTFFEVGHQICSTAAKNTRT